MKVDCSHGKCPTLTPTSKPGTSTVSSSLYIRLRYSFFFFFSPETCDPKGEVGDITQGTVTHTSQHEVASKGQSSGRELSSAERGQGDRRTLGIDILQIPWTEAESTSCSGSLCSQADALLSTLLSGEETTGDCGLPGAGIILSLFPICSRYMTGASA